MTDRDLNNAGRITHPMVLRPGATHYTPIEWPEAFQLVADELNALKSPNEAIFYTSGKVPNEPPTSTSCLSGSLAPTTCPTAPTCATRAAAPP